MAHQDGVVLWAGRVPCSSCHGLICLTVAMVCESQDGGCPLGDGLSTSWWLPAIRFLSCLALCLVVSLFAGDQKTGSLDLVSSLVLQQRTWKFTPGPSVPNGRSTTSSELGAPSDWGALRRDARVRGQGIPRILAKDSQGLPRSPNKLLVTTSTPKQTQFEPRSRTGCCFSP